MTDTRRPTNAELQQLITGEIPGGLTPEEAADVSVLAGLLGSSAIWAEPGADLEDAVVQAVTDADAAPADELAPRRRRVWPRVTASVAAVAACTALIVGVVAVHAEEHPAFKGNLAATRLVPGAAASIEMYKSDAGFRVSLDAHGLAALPSGEYYQAWVVNRAGVKVAIGTFSSSNGEVTLWSGVSPKTFSTVTVTIEPVDKDPGPSGRRVLVGVLHPN